MKKTDNLTMKFSFVQAFYCMSFAVVLGFSSVYLLDIGLANASIGVLIAIAGVISAILQPVLASYADRPGSRSVKQIVIGLSFVMIVLGILLWILYQKTVWATGLLYGCTVLVLQLINPFVNSLGMESINSGKQLDFGIAKGMGSVAYGAGSYVLGIIIGKLGERAIPIIIAVIYLILIAVTCVFPFEKKTITVNETLQENYGILSIFQKYKTFFLVFLGCLMLYISHLLLNNYLFQIIESKGGGSYEMGIAIAIGSFAELPVLFGFSFLLKKAGSNFWFRLSGIFFTIKAIGSLLVTSIPAFYGVQMMQLLAWGMISAAAVYYVNEMMNEQDAIKGQAYLTTAHTLGSVLASLAGGVLIDRLGVNAMIMAAVGSAAVGTVIVLLGVKKTK